MNNKLDLVLYKAYAELRRDIASAYLGMLWWVLDPLLYMAAFYMIFALGIRTGADDFVSFLLCGLVSWKWFASSINQAAVSVLNHRGLLQQVYLPKMILPLIPIAVNVVKFVVILVLLLGYLVTVGYKPAVEWLYLLPVIGVQLVLILGSSLLLAAIVPVVMDVRVLVANGMTMLMFMSGIFFSVQDVSAEMQFYFYLNPMVAIIEAYRQILLNAQVPDWSQLGQALAMAVVIGAMGLALFWRLDKHYPKIMP